MSPKRPRRRLLSSVALAVGALVSTGCADDGAATTDDGGTITADGRTSDERSQQTDELVEAMTANRHPLDPAAKAEELDAFAPQSVAGVFERRPDEVFGVGPMDLKRAISGDGGGPNVEKLLSESGFLRGYKWYYADDANGEFIVMLYEFANTDGALRYAAHARSTYTGWAAASPSELGEGCVEAAADEAALAYMICVHGRFMILIRVMYRSNAGAVLQRSRDVIEEMRMRLPA